MHLGAVRDEIKNKPFASAESAARSTFIPFASRAVAARRTLASSANMANLATTDPSSSWSPMIILSLLGLPRYTCKCKHILAEI
jgi:hypothetical protein